MRTMRGFVEFASQTNMLKLRRNAFREDPISENGKEQRWKLARAGFTEMRSATPLKIVRTMSG